MATLVLQDGTRFEGESFGASFDSAQDDTFGSGEVVFNTGMVGYPESLTDPSYRGQILVFTYPLIGNYGVPSEELNEYGFSKNFESEHIHVRAVICSQVSQDFSHHKAVLSLPAWLKKYGVPGITGVDTRALTKKLREHGVMLGRIVQDAAFSSSDDPELVEGEESRGFSTPAEVRRSKKTLGIKDPNVRNLVAEVSCSEVMTYEPVLRQAQHDIKTIVAYDCGMKRNILRSFLQKGVRVIRVPWNFNLSRADFQYDGVFISNGPGDPKMCRETIAQVAWALEKNIPTFGICLGIQLMALALGGNTYKLKYGHRGANQPCIEEDSEELQTSSVSSASSASSISSQKCIMTSQNHGFAVEEASLPQSWRVWFRNANDGTVEGIRHDSGRFFAVQFHPEATPGPEDAGYLFDDFLKVLKGTMSACAHQGD